MRYWWVNQNQTYKAEVGGGYVWSPKLKKNDARGSHDVSYKFGSILGGKLQSRNFFKSSPVQQDRPRQGFTVGRIIDIDDHRVRDTTLVVEQARNPPNRRRQRTFDALILLTGGDCAPRHWETFYDIRDIFIARDFTNGRSVYSIRSVWQVSCYNYRKMFRFNFPIVRRPCAIIADGYANAARN